MKATPKDQDIQLFQRLAAGESQALDALFRQYYVELCQVANRFVQRESTAEDIVQDFFVSLWEKRATLNAPDNVGSYLRRSIRNRSLNYLRDQKRIPVDDGEVPETIAAQAIGNKEEEGMGLKTRINQAINQLPERCRLVFTMSKLEEMSHREIAQRLDISTKTVENQMTRAYRYLRQWLALLCVLNALI
ncbi:RNA polymerase sigma-70 factor [Lewinella sp. 4G2]|uniref:RNA polymerase sigma-70 factor n=1 Tax=Lewinella sp. 4G2 TaxID=1803372 RepID=UPI0007B4A186|nr:RNA polymerase sigma-70 factor [Lewinella sp. 4G2]OAV45660.1 hypothetical protein A3850_014670 [Lewinella sp. 4G2]